MITCLENLQRWLHEQHVSYTVQHHRQAFTMQDVAAEIHEKGDHVAKVVIAQVDGALVMLVVPTPELVDFKRVARLLKAGEAGTAREADFEARFPDCELGAMPPFGHLYDMPTYVDEALTRTSKLVFEAGTHSATIKLATDDYLRLAQPKVAQLTQSADEEEKEHQAG